MQETDTSRALLRHTLATLAYRAQRALREAPPEFAEFRAFPTTRTPVEILAHMVDLLDWARALSDGGDWHDSTPQSWDAEVDRFFAALKAFDDRLAQGTPLAAPEQRLFQGPVADALTHVGQINMLRRMAGCEMRGENFFAAKIVTGKVGKEQAAPRREFD
jgi:hypothetical protein